MKTSPLHFAAAICLASLAPMALAHPGHGTAVADGLLHPLTGVDHLLTMLGVGIWSAQQKGHARWMIPACFVGLMALAAWLAALGFSVPFVENGIAASVLLIGLIIASSSRIPLALAAALAGLFAVFHGAAHGLELPGAVSGWLYGVGFLLATALLQALGFFAGAAAARYSSLARAAGAVIAAFGGGLVLQALR